LYESISCRDNKVLSSALSTSIDDLMVFCDRTEHKKFRMDSSAQQATAQTARTLRFDAALPPDADTITVEEFAKLLLREIAAAVRSFPPPDARPCP
jgi:hypothetical protein